MIILLSAQEISRAGCSPPSCQVGQVPTAYQWFVLELAPSLSRPLFQTATTNRLSDLYRSSQARRSCSATRRNDKHCTYSYRGTPSIRSWRLLVQNREPSHTERMRDTTEAVVVGLDRLFMWGRSSKVPNALKFTEPAGP